MYRIKVLPLFVVPRGKPAVHEQADSLCLVPQARALTRIMGV